MSGHPLSQHIHQRDSPLPAFRVGDDLALEYFIHPCSIMAYSWEQLFERSGDLRPSKRFGIRNTFWALRERRLASASSGVSL